MGARNAIGIDPDSKGFVCALVKAADTKVLTKGYLATEADLERFLKWVKGEGDVIVGIEGSNGLSKPIEKALREAGVIFYSVKPADTDRFRKAVLGQNKDNQKDAESVARYAMAMEAQGKLERYRRVWFADAELQVLTRSYERKSQAMTAEMNRLWKWLLYASPDLYLALAGSHPEVELKENMLKRQGFLALLGEKPNIGEWKNLSDDELLESMGGNEKGRHVLIRELRQVTEDAKSVTPAIALMIQGSAALIKRFKQQQSDITKILDELTKGSSAVQALKQKRGIGTITATTMIAEIIDIRRFVREDSLASYSGLGMREYSSGDTKRMIGSQLFNHRLKDAFMTGARNFVLFNPDSHLSGYYRNLVKAGMTKVEATKRVARALVRVVFRELHALQQTEANTRAVAEAKEGESDVASGLTRGEPSHTSDTSPSSLTSNKPPQIPRVKLGSPRRSSTPRRRKNAVSRKRA